MFVSRRLAGKAAKRKEFKEDFAILDVNEDDLKGDPRVWLTKVTSSYSSSYPLHVFHSAKNSLFFDAAKSQSRISVCTVYLRMGCILEQEKPSFPNEY
jgi:hypothetical protein